MASSGTGPAYNDDTVMDSGRVPLEGLDPDEVLRALLATPPKLPEDKQQRTD